MLFFNWLLHIFLKEILTNRVNAYANNGIVFDFILLKKQMRFVLSLVNWNEMTRKL